MTAATEVEAMLQGLIDVVHAALHGNQRESPDENVAFLLEIQTLQMIVMAHAVATLQSDRDSKRCTKIEATTSVH
jgi:hypothetical protein